MQDFIKQYPNTKVTTVDVGPKVFDDYFVDDWLEKPATALTHGYFQPTNFSYYAKQILHADEPNHGIILGVDKPRIVMENGKYYSAIIDKTLETFISDIPNIEFFYYAPDLPEMHLKQSWMTLNHIERTYGTSLIYTPTQIDPLRNVKLGAEVTSFTITSSLENKTVTKISDEFLKEYCGNSHSEYYDDFCIACGRGAAWNVNLGIQNGKSKYKNEGRDPLFQKLLQKAREENWESAHNFTDAMNYLKTSFSTIFNKEDPYQGTLGVFSKKYYMKDVT